VRAGREALMLHTLFYANEVGRAAFRVTPEEAGAKELQMAKLLVEAMEAKFEPENWNNAHLQKLTELIESRTPVETSPRTTAVAQLPAADILEALRKSLEVARKPVGAEREAPKSKRPAKRK
jgi:DNA end-binding protein Ku